MSLFAPLSIPETLARLKEGQTSVAQDVHTVLDRIRRVEPTLHAFLKEPDREARLSKGAAVLQEQFSQPSRRPPLYGLLVGVKDLFRVDGFETRAGSKLPQDLFRGQQAGSVTLLLEAGALVAGKTVTTEFAYFSPGPTRNPWNPEHTPGGSSSGSAAAVAAGLCHAALGTQTIGSVIRPAAFCGIVGFKPSFGRITTSGVFPFSVSADHVGVFASNVAGVERLAAVVCRPWNRKLSRTRSGAAGVRPAGVHPAAAGGRIGIAVPSRAYLEQADATARSAVDAALERLESGGYFVRRSDLLDDIERINAAHTDMIAAEFAQVHATWFEKHQALYSDKSAELIRHGRGVDSARLAQARQMRTELRERIARETDGLGITLWATPATSSAAPHGIEATGSPIMNLPWTHAGVPAITVPCGLSADGLPLGLQLTGLYDGDESLTAYAAAIEPIVALRDA